MTKSPTPRFGSAIWQRVDGKFTAIQWLPSGADNAQAYLPKVSTEELIAADIEHPGGSYIFDGNAPDDGAGGFEVERYDPDSLLHDRAVVLSPTKPPFGEWKRLDSWPSQPSTAREVYGDDFGDRPWPPRP